MNPELSAALNAVSRLLDGSPDADTIFGVQVLLEMIAASPEPSKAPVCELAEVG